MNITSRVAIGLACVVFLVTPATGGVLITFDAETLNDLIASVAVSRIEVPIPGGQKVEVKLEKLEVIGFRPAESEGHGDYILTSLKLNVPQFGLRISVKPRLSLQVVENARDSVLELRFEEVELPLPFARIDLAPLLPPIRYPAGSTFLLAGADGDVEVLSRVAKVSMTQEILQFEISLDVVEPVETPGN
jgi:hypothetical protein